MNYAQIFADYEGQLTQVGEEPESLTFTFRQIKGISTTDLILSLRDEVTASDAQLLDNIFQQLAQHVPAQYIIGWTEFFGLKFVVDRRVLIPRPETEELLELILSENGCAPKSVLDIGTGSGAIAIALAKHRPEWEITASDISADALAVAQENAKNHAVDVKFIQSDVFCEILCKYDIIVSNPPYIATADVKEVGLNVLHSEPHLALFADEGGVAIYRRITDEAKDYLTEVGKIYFEIGYKQGLAVHQLLASAFPDKLVRIHQDIFGKDRMVSASNA